MAEAMGTVARRRPGKLRPNGTRTGTVVDIGVAGDGGT